MTRKNRDLFQSPWILLLIIAAIAFTSWLSGGTKLPWTSVNISPAAKIELAEDELGLFFIDVGQGDCILAEINNETLLVDTGSGEAVMDVLDFLGARDIDAIDHLLLTHLHEDHMGNAAELLRRYDIGRLYLPDTSADTDTYTRMLEAAVRYNVPSSIVTAGDSFKLGAGECDIISPNREYDGEDHNNSSLVLRLTYGDTGFLLTGDAEAEAERDMIEAGWDLRADLLKVGHHGSYTSTTAEFLDAVQPSYAVISLAGDNEFGFPHDRVMDELSARDIEILRTDINGSVAAFSDGKTIRIFVDRQAEP